MTDIASIASSKKLTSQLKVSLEHTQQIPTVNASSASHEIEKMALEMEQMQHAFTLVHEIRSSLESALHDLNPQ